MSHYCRALSTKALFELRLLDLKLRYSKHQYIRQIDTKTGYSLKPFDDKKAVFIHLPKCAGVSVNKALFGNLAGGHLTYREYEQLLDRGNLGEYFTFTIVRNPWDRLVSAFHFLKGGGFGVEDQIWAQKHLNRYTNFSTFVKGWVNENNIWEKHHFRPQAHYLKNSKGQIDLNYIGRYESINHDFRIIANHLNIKGDLSHVNSSRRKSYHHYYDIESLDIVSQVYKEDIESLSYSFYPQTRENKLPVFKRVSLT